MSETEAKKKGTVSGVSQKPRWVKWTIKLGFVTLFSLLLLLTAAWLLLQTGPVRSYLKKILVSQIENRLNAEVSVGDIGGNLFSTLAIKDVRMSVGGTPLFSLNRISADYTLPLLVKNMVFLNALTIEGLQIHLHRNSEGVWNVTGLAKPDGATAKPQPSASSGVNVAVKNLFVKDSRVMIRDATTDPASSRQIDITRCGLDISVGRNITLRVIDSLFSSKGPDFNNVAITGHAVFTARKSLLKINAFDVQSEASSVALSGDLSLQKDRPEFDVVLRCNPLSLSEIEKGLLLSFGLKEDLTGTFAVKGDTAKVNCLTDVEYRNATLSASGDIGLAALPGLDLQIKGALRTFDPSILPVDALKTLAGNLNSDFDIQFNAPKTIAAGSGRFSMSVLPSHVAAQKVTSGGLSIELQNGDLKLKDTFFSSTMGDVSAEGRVSGLADSSSEKKADLSVFLKNIPLQQFPRFQASGVSGTMNLDLTASAALPAKTGFSKGVFKIDAGARNSSVFLSDKKVPTDALRGISLDGAWDDRQVKITSADVDTDFGRVTAKGAIDTRHLSGNIVADAEVTDFKRLSEAVFPLVPALPRDLGLSGSASLRAAVEGPLTAPSLTCRLSGTDVGAMDFVARQLTATGSWSGSSDRLDAEASVNLTGFKGKGQQFDRIDATASVADEQAAFTFDAVHDLGHEIIAEGKLDLPNAQPAHITFSRLAMRPKGLSDIKQLQNSDPIRLKWHQGVLDVMSCRIATEGAAIDLSGRIETTGARKLNLSARSQNLNLSHLPFSASKTFSLEGLLNLNLLLAGTLPAPAVSGSVLLTDGKASLLKSGLTYEQMEAKILFSKDRIDLQQVLLKGDKEGFLQGAGHIRLNSGVPSQIDISLTGENFLIPYQKSIHARVAPELTLAGNAHAPILTGTVTISEGRINLDRMAPAASPEIEIIEATGDDANAHQIAEKAPPPEIVRRLTANVGVKAPGKIWLKGQDINMEAGGEILLKKEPEKPFILLGDLRTLRGIYYFRGRQFKVEKGTVTFIGLEDPNPNIDIKAVARIQKADIIILVTGTARNLVLSLDSDPKMDPSDIISYLVFGKPTDGLKGGQAFNAEKAALGLSGSILASEMRSILGDVFFIDSFALDAGDNGSAGSVAVGKYVRPNIFVLYRRGFAEEKQNQIEISYEVNPSVRIETQLGDDKNSGVDLFWEFDF